MECQRTAEQVAAFLDAGPAEFIDHARSCPTCAETLRLLRERPEPSGELEDRLLATFCRWRDQPPL